MVNKVTAPTSDSLMPGQAYADNTYYQILEVELSDSSSDLLKNVIKNVKVVTRSRGEFKYKKDEKDEKLLKYRLDDETVHNLHGYPLVEGEKGGVIGSYLPSSGVFFPEGFLDSLITRADSLHSFQTPLGTFYRPYRTLLQTRKISQLIAKTWVTYVKNYKTGGDQPFDSKGKFVHNSGFSKEFLKNSAALDNQIAREIFLSAMEPPNAVDNTGVPDWMYSVNYPYGQKPPGAEDARYFILPSNECWHGIRLALLLAGQAYRKLPNGEYHQICPPILSTGEIVSIFSVEVDFNVFAGRITEYIGNEQLPVPYSILTIPYPPIPSEQNLSRAHIERWADAELEGGELPFYTKLDRGQYLIQATHPHPPYPFLPVSMS